MDMQAHNIPQLRNLCYLKSQFNTVHYIHSTPGYYDITADLEPKRVVC